MPEGPRIRRGGGREKGFHRGSKGHSGNDAGTVRGCVSSRWFLRAHGGSKSRVRKRPHSATLCAPCILVCAQGGVCSIRRDILCAHRAELCAHVEMMRGQKRVRGQRCVRASPARVPFHERGIPPTFRRIPTVWGSSDSNPIPGAGGLPCRAYWEHVSGNQIL